MANLGDVGFALPFPVIAPGYSTFGANQANPVVHVTIAGTGVNISSVPNAFLTISRNAVQNDRTRADGSGVWYFYDLDNSGTQIYSVTAYTQDGATGEAWAVTIVAGVATVTKTFSAQRALAAAFA